MKNIVNCVKTGFETKIVNGKYYTHVYLEDENGIKVEKDYEGPIGEVQTIVDGLLEEYDKIVKEENKKNIADKYKKLYERAAEQLNEYQKDLDAAQRVIVKKTNEIAILKEKLKKLEKSNESLMNHNVRKLYWF